MIFHHAAGCFATGFGIESHDQFDGILNIIFVIEIKFLKDFCIMLFGKLFIAFVDDTLANNYVHILSIIHPLELQQQTFLQISSCNSGRIERLDFFQYAFNFFKIGFDTL